MKVWVEGEESVALHEDIMRLNQETKELRDEVFKWQMLCAKMTDLAERLATMLAEAVENGVR